MNDNAARRNGRCRGALPVGPWNRRAINARRAAGSSRAASTCASAKASAPACWLIDAYWALARDSALPLLAIQVNPDRHQIRLHEAYGRRIQSRDRPPRTDVPQPLAWIILGDEPGGALAPSSADVNANARIRLDVPDVARPAPVLGNDPKDPVVEAVGDRVASRLPGLATNGLQDRDPRRRNPDAKQPADDGIDRVPG